MKTSKPRILVIDDDSDYLGLCKIALAADFTVELAANGEEAIERLGTHAPSAVLLDLMMPRVSGFDVLEYMQLWPAMRKIPVLIITACNLRGGLKEKLTSRCNVCNCFEKTVALDTVSNEAHTAVAMGRLYKNTPRLIKVVEKAEAASKRRISARKPAAPRAKSSYG